MPVDAPVAADTAPSAPVATVATRPDTGPSMGQPQEAPKMGGDTQQPAAAEQKTDPQADALAAEAQKAFVGPPVNPDAALDVLQKGTPPDHEQASVSDIAGQTEITTPGKAAGDGQQEPTPTAQPEIPVITGTPAEGMDLDPRYGSIVNELKQKWLQEHPGQDLLSAEGQSYNLGHIDPNKKNLPTLQSDAQRLFRERYAQDANAYDEKEKTRVYDSPSNDPAVVQAESNILAATNLDPQVRNGGTRDVWGAVNSRESIHGWDTFVQQYPEKAKAYADKGHDELKKALERQQQRAAQQSRTAEAAPQQPPGEQPVARQQAVVNEAQPAAPEAPQTTQTASVPREGLQTAAQLAMQDRAPLRTPKEPSMTQAEATARLEAAAQVGQTQAANNSEQPASSQQAAPEQPAAAPPPAGEQPVTQEGEQANTGAAVVGAEVAGATQTPEQQRNPENPVVFSSEFFEKVFPEVKNDARFQALREAIKEANKDHPLTEEQLDREAVGAWFREKAAIELSSNNGNIPERYRTEEFINGLYYPNYMRVQNEYLAAKGENASLTPEDMKKIKEEAFARSLYEKGKKEPLLVALLKLISANVVEAVTDLGGQINPISQQRQ